MRIFHMCHVMVYFECRKKNSWVTDEAGIASPLNLTCSLLKPQFFLRDATFMNPSQIFTTVSRGHIMTPCHISCFLEFVRIIGIKKPITSIFAVKSWHPNV